MKKYYVYELGDPRDGSVFYVGKGTGSRAWQHTRKVLNGGKDSNARKMAKIRAILDAGHHPSVNIIAEYDNQEDALEHEAELISVRVGLTNILARGNSWKITPEEAERRAAERAIRIQNRKTEKDISWLRKWLAVVDKWPGVTFPGMANGDELAVELVAYVRQITVPAPII